jgi:predicted  nucleic acid-binding Zn-ribbon protein
MAYEQEITAARHVINDDQRKLALMRQLAASEERITHFSSEISAWQHRLKNLEAAR